MNSLTGSVVITHPEWGVYLGNCLGMGFWSELDPVGQPAAVVFDNETDARNHVSSWVEKFEGLNYFPIKADSPCGRYVSEPACRLAGLKGWVYESMACEGSIQ